MESLIFLLMNLRKLQQGSNKDSVKEKREIFEILIMCKCLLGTCQHGSYLMYVQLYHFNR